MKEFLGIYSTIEEKRAQESDITDKLLANIKNEYKNIAGMSTTNSSGISNLYNFSSLVRNDMDASVLYVYVLSNYSGQYSVTIGNFLKTRINATLNASYAVYNFSFINDRANSTAQFAFSQTGTINITLTYNLNGVNYTEALGVHVSTTRNIIFAFFDITLRSGEISIRSKEIFNRTVV
jgi:hypothetical protein